MMEPSDVYDGIGRLKCSNVLVKTFTVSQPLPHLTLVDKFGQFFLKKIAT